MDARHSPLSAWLQGSIPFFLFPCDAITGSLYIFQKKVGGTTLSPFHSTALCHLSGNFAFRPPAALLPLGAQSCSTGLLQSSWNQKFLSSDRNWVYWTKWPRERTRSGEYCGRITTARPDWKPFPWSPKTNVGSHLILKLQSLLLINSGFFPSESVFRWSDNRQYLLPLTCWISTENSYCRTPSAILSAADRQPTLDTVGTDEMRLHGRGSCGWTSCLSLLARLCYYYLLRFLSICISGPLICRIPAQLYKIISWP